MNFAIIAALICFVSSQQIYENADHRFLKENVKHVNKIVEQKKLDNLTDKYNSSLKCGECIKSGFDFCF
jgi:hypothetical protein